MAAFALVAFRTDLRAEVRDDTWAELRGRHFVVRYRADAGFARRVLDRAEAHYTAACRRLGFVKADEFWTWDRRVTVTIYVSRQLFRETAAAPAWAIGKADYRAREIATFEGSGEFSETVLPHEIAHLVLRDYLGPVPAPLWLHEGFAQLNEQDGAVWRGGIAGLPPLRVVLATTAADLPADHAPAAAYYRGAAALVGGLIETYGTERFQRFCRALRDGRDLDGALSVAYAPSIRDSSELTRVWPAQTKETP